MHQKQPPAKVASALDCAWSDALAKPATAITHRVKGRILGNRVVANTPVEVASQRSLLSPLVSRGSASLQRP